MACSEERPVTAIYDRSCMPSVLTNYGFEDRSSPKITAVKKVKIKKEKKPKKKDSFDDAEDEAELEKNRERDEYYERMVNGLYKLRDYYYNEYSSLLSDKVEKQRQKIRERDLILQKQREKKEEEERKASHTVKKRLARHTLETTPITVAVPKTDIYHIVGLEQKLKKQGKLKTVSDFTKFREDMEDPVVFKTQFKVPKNTAPPESIKSPRTSLLSSSQGQGSDLFSIAPDPVVDPPNPATLPPRALSRISELHESSRPGTRAENWAVTQQAHYHNRRRSSGAIQPLTKKKSDYAADLEKRFPKLEMPQLRCFTMNLDNKPPDPEVVLQQAELRAREKQRKKALRTVTKMYQLAMANSATHARIMDQQDGDLDLLMHGPDLCDTIADHHWMTAYGLRELPEEVASPVVTEEQELEQEVETETELWSQQPVMSESQAELTQATDPPLAIMEEARSRASSKRSRGSAKSHKSPRPSEPKTPMALTLDEIQGECNIKEAKGLSTLWTNYLRSGKNPMKP